MGGGRSHRRHYFLCLSHFFFSLAPLACVDMAPIQRFSTAEKGKSPLDEPELLPPKKKRSHHREIVVRPVVSQPWYEGPPPRYPLPLYAQADDSGEGVASGAARIRVVVAELLRRTPLPQGSMPRALRVSSCCGR